MNNQVTAAFVKSLLAHDPALAEEVIARVGLDLYTEVLNLIKDRIQSAEMFGTTPEENVRLLIKKVGTERVVQEFQEVEFTEDILDTLSILLPELLAARRREVVEFLGAPILRPNRMDHLEKAVPGITRDIIAEFNAHPESRNLSDEDLVAKIRQTTYGEPWLDSGFAPDLYDRFLAADIADRMIKRIGLDGLLNQLMDDKFPKDRQVDVLKSIVTRLADVGLFINAANVAMWADADDEMRQLEIEMAQKGYAGCIERNQFKDAAELSERHKIKDECGAAKKELERLEAEKKYDQAISWAKRFDVPMPYNTASEYGKHCELKELERLVITEPEVYKRVIRERFGRGSLYLYAKDKKIFTDEETINDLSGEAIRKGPKEIWVIEMLHGLKKLGRGSCREAIARNIIRGWVKFEFTTPEEIELLALNNLPNVKKEDVRLMVKQIALDFAAEGVWDDFMAVCKTWGFNDLMGSFMKMVEFLPQMGPWRQDFILLGTVLDVAPDRA